MQPVNPSLCLIADLKPRLGNPRTHSKKQIRQIARSIESFGFVNPILVDDKQQLLAGHGRLAAAKELGMEAVPVLEVTHMTEAQKRAYVIADNRLAEHAGWDDNLLRIEFEGLLELETSFDLSVTGFESADVDFLIQSAVSEDENPDEDEFEVALTSSPITSSGDLWLLGDHKVYCGDSTKRDSYTAVLGEEKAQMVFADPPYNVPIAGHVSGLGAVRHKDFAMASGEMTYEQFTAFLEGVFGHMAASSQSGSIQYVCMDWRHLGEIHTAGTAIYSELKNVCVWNKDNGGMGSLYRSKHELVFVFKNGASAHINNVELGKHGRNRTNVWNYPGVNSFNPERMEDLASHPTAKPVALVADAILDCSLRGGIVLDPFGGSGSTLLAAERTGRFARLIELEPHYVDATIRRWQSKTGRIALHSSSGVSFSEMEDSRHD